MANIKVRIDGDGSGLDRALDKSRKNVKDFGGDVEKYINDKFKNLVAPVVIEQSIQRTAEWATELTKASQAMGITTSELQALKTIGRNSFAGEDGLINFYKKLQAAAKEAANGNVFLADSLKKLGVTNYKSSTVSEMFGEISSKVGPTAKTLSEEQIKSLRRISGEENIGGIVSALQEVGGKSVKQYGEEKGNIIPVEKIREISVSWNDMLTTLQKIGKDLSPIAVFLINVVNDLAKQLQGIVFAIMHPIESLKNIGTILKGIANGITGMFGVKFFKVTGENIEKFEKAGEGIATILTSFIGKFFNLLSKFEWFSNSVGKFLDKILGKLFGKQISKIDELGMEAHHARGAAETAAEEGDLLTASREMQRETALELAKKEAQKQLEKSTSRLGTALQIGVVAGENIIRSGVANEAAKNAKVKLAADIQKRKETEEAIQKIPINRFDAQNVQSIISESNGGGGMMRIGGIFGMDVSNKIISLNQQMVDGINRLVQLNEQKTSSTANYTTLIGNP